MELCENSSLHNFIQKLKELDAPLREDVFFFFVNINILLESVENFFAMPTCVSCT
jgi:hypothetical protein